MFVVFTTAGIDGLAAASLIKAFAVQAAGIKLGLVHGLSARCKRDWSTQILLHFIEFCRPQRPAGAPGHQPFSFPARA